jgi:hypothetical protein
VVWSSLAVLLVAYIPGALAFRLPLAQRDRRAALAAEERLFWQVILSVGLSLSVALALAAAGVYTLNRLIAVNAILSAAMLAAWRRRLLLRGTAVRPRWTIALVAALIALGAWRFFPPAEYLIGGKDPGTYMNEGFLIARRGGIVVADRTIAAVPPPVLDLFFTPNRDVDYYDARFMGFFLRDPSTGETVGQLPHLYPASIAIAYGIGGVRGALRVTGWWAILGLLAVYFAAARLIGPTAAFATAGLLGLHVLQVWWGRYPNAEIAMQALTFAALLAFARAHQDEDAFFAPVAGWLVGLLPFARLESVVVIAAVVGAMALMWIVQRRAPPRLFVISALAGISLACWYYSGPLSAYSWDTFQFLTKVPMWLVLIGLGAAAAAVAMLLWARRRWSERTAAAIPGALIFVVLAMSAYAWFFRTPAGTLTDYNAHALRAITDVYLLRPALAAGLIGFALLVRGRFWRAPALLLVITVFTVFVCYKIRIVPEHFWLSRRVLPIMLPGLLMFVAAAALGGLWNGGLIRRTALGIVGGLFVVWLGARYAAAAAPIAAHIEYAGLAQYLETLAARIGDRDLLIVESRDVTGSDNHVFAAPLAYLYDRHVLVLESPVPDKAVLEAFLADAARTYTRVLFLGGGGTDLLSRRITATPIADARVQLPEYEVTPWQTLPDEVRRKDFDYSLYQLSIAASAAAAFTLDIGYQDDLHVVRFHAKEVSDGRTIRWTGAQSFVAVPGLSGQERTVSIVMHDGGRPAAAGAAIVDVSFDGTPLGTITVASGFQTYTLALPADAARAAAARDAPARLVFRSRVWVPQRLIGGSDDRELGVMVDKVEIR